METNEIAAIGYAIAMTVFAPLTGLLLSRWKNNPASKPMAIAAAAGMIWGAVLALQSLGYVRSSLVTVGIEWLRYLAWLAALLAILRQIDPSRLAERVGSRYGFIVLLFAGIPFTLYVLRSDDPIALIAIVGGGFLLTTLILSAAEQIYRNAPVDARAGLNYFCVAIAGIFLFDLLSFVFAIAGATTETEYWAARGFVSGLFAVPLGVGVMRTFRLSLEGALPRQIVFYSFGLTAIGIYLVLTVMGHYYVVTYGGAWGQVGAVVFVVASVGLVGVLSVSPSVRARLRVFVMKTFFEYKYDYRREWLRFIATLSKSGLENVPTTAIRAVAQIVSSPGGLIWLQEEEGESYLLVGSWGCPTPTLPPIGADSSLAAFLSERQWVIDLDEMKRFPARYEGLEPEPWLEEDGWWLIVPLLLGSRLSGFILLKRPRFAAALNFEDHDLLRTVGRHVATHINQAESDRRLAESSQFGTYNRLAAFLMHDLNNLIAQQSLVVKNAERFRDNPKFVDDAIDTIAHSVARMKRLMEQFSSRSGSPVERQTIDLREALGRAVERRGPTLPRPGLEVGESPILVRADPERLTTVLEHLVRNAQDATGREGRVAVAAELVDGVACVRIQDDGCGMSPEFIRERLFRPFDSTKGSESMGIGAYQAREYVRALGGNVEITSEVGAGTTFAIRLPTVET